RRKRALRGTIGVDEGLAGVFRGRADIHDRSRDAVSDHALDRFLHQEVRATHIGRKERVEKLRRSVENRSPVGERTGVYEHVHAAKETISLRNDLPTILNAREITASKVRGHAEV